jgi:transglutaminase-like putative cysteine protease
MNLAIDYEARYAYDSPASLSTHTLRLFPRPDPLTSVIRQALATADGAEVHLRRDLYDNVVASCFFPEPLSVLPVRMHLELDVPERNPFDFLLEPRGLQIPCAYTGDEQLLLAPFLRPTQRASLPKPLAAAARPTVEALLEMNRWIADSIAYERREEGDPLPIAETLARKRAACRDVAVLLAEALRHNGVAARLAAGFLWEGDRNEAERFASSAMHAWVEAYVPGAGWIGLDPTHGVLCDHAFVTTAVGLAPADIAPVSGSYFSDAPVGSRLETSVEVRRI